MEEDVLGLLQGFGNKGKVEFLLVPLPPTLRTTPSGSGGVRRVQVENPHLHVPPPQHHGVDCAVPHHRNHRFCHTSSFPLKEREEGKSKKNGADIKESFEVPLAPTCGFWRKPCLPLS